MTGADNTSTVNLTGKATVSGVTAAGGPLRRGLDLIRSEWTKLWSVRSTWLMVLVSFTAAVGIGALTAHADIGGWDTMTPAQRGGVDALADPLFGLLITQLVLAVLGGLTITGEYSNGLIHTTLAAAPGRSGVLAAKAVALAGTVLITGTLTTLAAFGTGEAILATKHIGLSLEDPQALRGLGGAIAYLLAAGLIGLSLGTLLRHTGGTIAALVVLLFLAPELLHGTSPWMVDVANALPGTAVRRLVSEYPWRGAPSVPLAFTVVAAYPAALLTAAATAFRLRDA